MTNPCALRRALVAAAACFRRNVGRGKATSGTGDGNRANNTAKP
jgi:hypothetical protein